MASMQDILSQVSSLPGGSEPFINPYAGHRGLSETEQELLGEYARLAATIHRVSALSTLLCNSSAHSSLLSSLRTLERKMGLVLTLFKASVWAIVQEQQDVQEAEAAAAAEEEARMLQINADPQLEMGLGLAQRQYYGEEGDSLFIENVDGEGDETVVAQRGVRY
ncbi:hypothetical protein ACQY0O_007911 [Thecaphora frezii]